MKGLSLTEFLNFDCSLLHMSVDSAEKHSILKHTVRTTQVYKVVLVYEEKLMHTVPRRYSEFLTFDTKLRSAFPKLELPAIPSKLSLLNKIETRKKAFNTYVSSLVTLLRSIPAVTSRDLMLRKIAEFLNIEGADDFKEADPRILEAQAKRSDMVDTAQIDAKKGTYTGYVEIKHNLRTWKRYFASLITSEKAWDEEESKSMDGERVAEAEQSMLDLYLFASETVICLRGAEVRDSLEGPNILELIYDYQAEPIYIRCAAGDFSEWKSTLIQQISGQTQSVLQPYPNCGLLYVKGKVSSVSSLTGVRLPKPAVSVIKPHLFVRLTLPPFLYMTSIKPQSPTIIWDQEFIFPISNPFFSLQIEVMSFSSEGWLKQHPKEELLTSFSIPLPYIALPPYTTGEVTVPLDNQELMKKITPLKSAETDFSAEVSMNLRAQDWSSNGNIILKPPPSYIEENPIPKSMSLGKFKLAYKRIKRLMIFVKRFNRKFKMVQMWTYPRFSGFLMVFLVLAVLFLPEQYFLPLFLAILILLIGICHPVGDYLIGNYLYRQFFHPKRRCEQLPQVKTMKECDEDKLKDIGNFSIDVRPAGFIEKYKILKKDLAELQVDLSHAACWGEKIRK